MIIELRRDLRTIVVSVVAASIVFGVPATAATIVANSDKVDGKHAVGYGATESSRRGRLVATNATTGRLPNNIIAQAPDANLLDGKDSTQFLTTAGKATDADRLDGMDSTELMASKVVWGNGSATCGSGWKVMGGGYKLPSNYFGSSNSSEYVQTSSYPSSSTTWTADAQKISGSYSAANGYWTYTTTSYGPSVYAICTH